MDFLGGENHFCSEEDCFYSVENGLHCSPFSLWFSECEEHDIASVSVYVCVSVCLCTCMVSCVFQTFSPILGGTSKSTLNTHSPADFQLDILDFKVTEVKSFVVSENLFQKYLACLLQTLYMSLCE